MNVALLGVIKAMGPKQGERCRTCGNMVPEWYEGEQQPENWGHDKDCALLQLDPEICKTHPLPKPDLRDKLVAQAAPHQWKNGACILCEARFDPTSEETLGHKSYCPFLETGRLHGPRVVAEAAPAVDDDDDFEEEPPKKRKRPRQQSAYSPPPPMAPPFAAMPSRAGFAPHGAVNSNR